MKPRIVTRFAVCILFQIHLSQVPRVKGAAVASSRNAVGNLDVPSRIARIENGLLPAVAIKGSSLPRMKLSDRMEYYKVPGLSIAFFENGQIAWTRSYGYADVARKQPVTQNTLFQAASISKPVSALAALRLVQDGKLNLDEDVNLKLHTWKIPGNHFTKVQKVTLRRILSHTAGLTVHGFPGYATGEPLPTMTQILDGEKPANTLPIRVDVVPGAISRYSGGGYVVMQLLLTDVTGEPFQKILRRLVLDPAGLTHSTYEQPLPTMLLPNAATAYQDNGSPVAGGWHTYPEMAPAGLWTTPSDLARLAIEVQNEYTGRSKRILSQEMTKQMLTIQSDESGLGFAVKKEGKGIHFGHGGSNEGFECDLEAYTDSRQGVVIMTNGQQGLNLIAEIRRAIANEYNWPDFRQKEHTLVDVDPSVLRGYAGLYDIPEEGKIPIALKQNAQGKDRLYVDWSGPQELLPESDRQFFILSQDLVFTFQKDEKSAGIKLVIQSPSRTLLANKEK